MQLELISAYGHQQEIAALFTEYTRMLMDGDDMMRHYLTMQGYEKELEHPEAKYGFPDGRLYLAYCDSQLAGCIALRKLDEQRSELKRLYVRPQFRGSRIGEALVRRVLSDAREIGYRHVLLDTLPFLRSAIGLYRRVGFYEIPCYNDSPMDNTIFMQFDL